MDISNKSDLDAAILALEKKKLQQRSLLMRQVQDTKDSLQPKQLLRGAFDTISHSPEARNGILKTVTGLAVSMLTKKLFLGKSPSFIHKIIGNALRVGVAKVAVSNTDKIKAVGTAIFSNLFGRKPKTY